MDDHDEDDDTVIGNCLHCNAPPPPRSSEDSVPDSTAATRVQVSCDDCRSFICDGCHWCHEFQANHEIRVCDRCDAFYCRGCDEMDQCEDCSEVVCNTCSTLMSCKFCGCGLCEDCATACGRCGIVLCARDAKFAVECDTCKMSYCLVCLASGTKDPCVRCGHRPSKRVEQLVHLRLKSIYKAFKQSGASVSPADTSSSGSSGHSSGGTGSCNHPSGSNSANNKAGRDASTIGGKYSSTLRSLAESDSSGTPKSDSKDNIGTFDQSMANEVAAVLQTASKAMKNSADGDATDGRRSKGKRVPSHDLNNHSTGPRNRPRAGSASERYYRKTQAEIEAAAAAAEADAEAAAAALLAELDEEDAAVSKKNKKKKKKKEKKKESPPEQVEQLTSNPTTQSEASSHVQKKKTDKKSSAAKSTTKDSDDDSSDEEINFEQLVGRTKGSAKPLKKKDKKEVEVEEKTTAVPISKPTVEPPSPTEPSTDFDKELAILLSSDDEQGLESFLDKLRGVPGLGAARKTAKKALKRIKEAKEPAPFEGENQLPFQTKTKVAAVEIERKSLKNLGKGAQTGPDSRANNTNSTIRTTPAQSSTAPQEPLLRVVSRTPSITASGSTKKGTSNSASTQAARGECVMHMSPLLVGWVIGKGGQRIRDMMEESGAKIWIDQESMDAKEARVVYVSGKLSSVDSAVKMVKDLVAKAPIAANAGQTPPLSKSNSVDEDDVASAADMQKSLPTTDSSKEPPSFAAAIASKPAAPPVSTKPVPTQEVPVATKGWPATQQAAAPKKSPAVPIQANISIQPSAAPIMPQISDNITKEFSCNTQLVSRILAAGTINLIQTESGANLRVDQSCVPSKITIHGRSANVNKAEQFLRSVLGSESASPQVVSHPKAFGSGDPNALANLTHGFEGVSLSSYEQPTQAVIPPGYTQTSQPGSLGLFSDSPFATQSKSLPSQTIGGVGLQYNQPQSSVSQNHSILPQFPPQESTYAQLSSTNQSQPSAFNLPVDLNPSYNVSSQLPLSSHQVSGDRIQGAAIGGLSNNTLGDTWNDKSDQSHSGMQHNLQFDQPLFTDIKQRVPEAGSFGGIPLEQNQTSSFSGNDSQMVDNMFASLGGGIGGNLLSDLNSGSQPTWGSLNGWGDTATQQSQQFSRLDSLDSSHHNNDERRRFG